MTNNREEIEKIDPPVPWGCFPALVTDNRDPEGLGRVAVKLPWFPDPAGEGYEAWARVATLMAGSNRGSWFIPDIGDEVLVMFEAGDPRRPVVIGALWNGQDTPPETMDDQGDNHLKSLVSRQGIRITLDDHAGAETLTLRTPHNQTIMLTDGDPGIAISDQNGNTIRLDPAGITISTAAKVVINASTIGIASGMVTIDAGMSRFSGVVQADTLIANSVIASTYSPGVGNVL